MPKKNTAPADDQKSQMSTGSFILPGNAFDDASGETFAGLNVLRLKEGEVGGPFVLKEILPNQKLGENKKMKPVDVYVGIHEASKLEIRMPAAASFVQKAKDAALGVGDVFLIRRSADYIAKKFGKNNCASYELKITSRKNKK